MYFKQLPILAFAGLAGAQAPSLLQALNSSTQLGSLSAILSTNPDLVNALGQAQNITILAPSNTAFGKINSSSAALLSNQGLVTALLQYHVLNGSFPASAISNTSAFVPTLLTNPLFTNVTGGQRVNAVKRGSNVTIFSGLLNNSTVTQADVNFTGGVIHVIDTVLTLPQIVTDTLSAAGLSSLRGALNATDLVQTVNTTPNLTIFAPTNQAFQNIGSALTNLTAQQTRDVLLYHAVPGLGYSSTLRNGTVLRTVGGQNLTITINSGRVFVNNARVTTADLLVANGVVHVIDAVLNPTNATIANASATTGAGAFASATPISNAPFTSGQPAASTTISPQATSAAAPGASSTRSSTAGAALPMKTAAVGMSALLGAAAAYLL